MKNIIELNIEIDASNKIIYMSNNNSSGVEERYNSFDDIPKYIKKYLEMYHKAEIEESGKLMTIKEDMEFIYDFLKEQNETEWIDLEKLKVLQDKKYVLPGDTPKDLQAKLDKLLEELWSALGDVPFVEIDGELYLDDDYLDFEVETTSREDIWHWFDERYSKGVYHLLYEFDMDNEKASNKEKICFTEINERIPKEERDKDLFYYECRTCDGETTIERNVRVDFSGMFITDKEILGDKEYIEINELFNDSKYEFLDDSDIYEKVIKSWNNTQEEEEEP